MISFIFDAAAVRINMPVQVFNGVTKLTNIGIDKRPRVLVIFSFVSNICVDAGLPYRVLYAAFCVGDPANGLLIFTPVRGARANVSRTEG